jgi:hypothetical protein
MSFIPWAKIHHFSQVYNEVNHINSTKPFSIGKVFYKSKVKLHGTNGGVLITKEGNIFAQSRRKTISVDSDNYDFAKFVELNSDKFKLLVNDEDIVIFGEWCGSGVQDKVALCKLDKKIFVVFGILYPSSNKLISEPSLIESLLNKVMIDNLFILPWFEYCVEIDFAQSSELMEGILEPINKLVDDIERSDPWVKSVFGIDGVGEGLVFYPVGDSYDNFKELSFKAKGELHRVAPSCKPVQAKVDISNEIEFVKLALTEARLSQGISELGICERKDIKLFFDWVINDVLSECKVELVGLNEKVVLKEIQKVAAKWFCNKF